MTLNEVTYRTYHTYLTYVPAHLHHLAHLIERGRREVVAGAVDEPRGLERRADRVVVDDAGRRAQVSDSVGASEFGHPAVE